MKKSAKKCFIITFLLIVAILICGFIFFQAKDKFNIDESNLDANTDFNLINTGINEGIKIDENYVRNLLSSYEEYIGKIENLSFESNYRNDYRFIQNYKGLEVYRGGIIATVKDNEILNIVNYTFEIPVDFNITPTNTKEDLLGIAKNYLQNNEAVPQNISLIIYPLTNTKFTLAYLYEFDEGNVIVNDKDKTLLIKSGVFENTAINTSVSEEATEKFYNYLVDDIEKFLQFDGKYVLTDNERNIELYRIKDGYDVFKNNDDVKNRTDYYERIIFEKSVDKYNEEYLAIKTMSHLQKIYDYYNKEFGFISMKMDVPYTLRVFTNFSIVGDLDFRNNAALATFSKDDMRLYLGSYNYHNDNLEVLAHEYTHGFFKTIVDGYDDNMTQAIREAYSDIMGMIIEAYYGDGKIDGIYGERAPRAIISSNLNYTNYNEATKYHESSMIVSKVAYLMSINEELNMNINDLGELWFFSMHRLPKNIVSFDDVEKAILIKAKELGYSEEKIREMANIFVSLGYPDYFEECYHKKVIKAGMEEKNGTLDKSHAEEVLYKNLGEWRGIKCNFEYIQTLSDENGNIYYIFDKYAEENFINYGGEGLSEVEGKGFYAGSYYVSNAYYKNQVYTGWARFRKDDKVSIFIDYYYFDVEEGEEDE